MVLVSSSELLAQMLKQASRGLNFVMSEKVQVCVCKISNCNIEVVGWFNRKFQ